MNKPDWKRAVSELVRLESTGGRTELGAFSIEGLSVHERALEAGAPLAWCVVSQSFHATNNKRECALLSALADAQVTIHVAPDATVEQLVGGRTFGSIVGCVTRAALSDTPRLKGDSGAVYLAAIDVVDPGNAGALVRTARAGGASAFVAVGHTDPFHPKAVRTSMGNLFHLPILVFETAGEFTAECARAGVRTVASVAQEGAELPAASLPRPAAIVMGSEAFGLSDEFVAAADESVTIPMIAGMDSLSVNAAAAVLLYEFGRRPAP